MKKIANLLLTALAALLMVFSSFGSVTAFAQQTFSNDGPASDAKFDIVLTKIKMKDDAALKAFDGVKDYDGSPLTVDKFGAEATTLDGVWFEVHKFDASKDNNIGALVGTDGQGQLTKDGGKITFKNLPAGKYVLVEDKSKSLVGAQEQLANAKAVPMEIELPVFKTDGSWFTTVEKNDALHVYPKNSVDKPSLTKRVDETNMHATALIGQAKTFTIKSTMPQGIKDYQELTFDDDFSAGLSYAGNFKALLKRGAAPEAPIADTAYILSAPAVGTKDADLKIEFTTEYIKTLEPGDVITLKYDATINEDAIMGAANPNKVILTYGNNPKGGGNPKTGPTPPPGEDYPELHTGGKKFEKKDKAANKALPGAKFVVKNADGKFLKQTKTGDVVTKNEWIEATDAKDAVTKGATELVSGADGKFEVKGLPYGTPNQKASEGSTDYQLIETEAPTGYAMLQEAITFKVNATSYYKDPTKVNALESADPQVVNNNKVTIPQTGGIGSVVVIATGIAVAGLGLVLKRRMAK
ncbi:TPA: SpaH/EbpB family LPXTG-anchored major pilin [Streptococcus suis]|nr:SpaH/EbpB family LPXTG-anchored major pilin [Streptococcus suis]